VISGRVLLHDGTGAPDAPIRLDGVVVSRTCEEGWFVVLGVSGGRHRLEATAPGALRSGLWVDADAGQLVEVGATRLVLGDVYPDNRVDALDALLVAATIGRCQDSGVGPGIDLDRDGCVDADDYAIVIQSFGRRGPTSWTDVP
jgi:hypothetical protein